MKSIRISKTLSFIIVDDEDYEKLRYLCWRRSTGGTIQTKAADGKMYSVPNMIFNNRLMYDHIDRNRLNNQKANLRQATQSQNHANSTKMKGKTSKYKGVTAHQGKWMAQLHKDGKIVYLGMFESEEKAARAYNKAAPLYFGEFANINKLS